jgi:hypothetical protein
MNLFKPKTYGVWDFGVVKLCVLGYGMVAGAYFSSWVKAHRWLFAVVFVVTCVRAVYFYWGIKKD